MSIYEEKMPAYLVMSRGDLIAEVLEAGGVVHTHLEQEAPPDFGEDAPERPKPVEDAGERVRIANEVLRERFGIVIHFHGNYASMGGGGLSELLGL